MQKKREAKLCVRMNRDINNAKGFCLQSALSSCTFELRRKKTFLSSLNLELLCQLFWHSNCFRSKMPLAWRASTIWPLNWVICVFSTHVEWLRLKDLPFHWRFRTDKFNQKIWRGLFEQWQSALHWLLRGADQLMRKSFCCRISGAGNSTFIHT